MRIWVLMAFLALGMDAQLSWAFGRAASDQSWQEIRADSGLQVVQPQYAAEFGEEGLFNACVEGDVFRSISPVRACVESEVVHHPSPRREASWDEVICRRWDFRDGAVARTFEESYCVSGHMERFEDSSRWKCDREGVRTVVRPIEVTLEVRRVHRGHGIETKAFDKSFQVPNCNRPQ